MRYLLSILAFLVLGSIAHAQCFPEASCKIVPAPAIQTIAGGDTIAADACQSFKRISSAGAVSTSLVNTFTAPSGGNLGCWMVVCNVGANNITLDNNANFKSAGGADVVLTQDDCVSVIQGATVSLPVWYQISALLAN